MDGVRRAGRALWRVARHEWTLVVLASLPLAAALTWPTLRDPAGTLPQDTGDPTLQAWQVAWGGHALRTDPAHLWHSNTFFPEPYTYAYSDTLLGFAPFALIGEGPVAAVVRYNLLYVLVHALAFVGAYALSRQLGAGRAGAAVAGASFAYAPWKLAQAGHLHVLSIGGVALALAMLARGHGWSLRHGYRPDRVRPGWAGAGWAVAAWQVTLGFGIGLPFAYVLGLLGLAVAGAYGVTWWRRRSRPAVSRGLLLADLAGVTGFAGVSLLMAAPYLEVVARHPAGRRTAAQVAMFSPPARGFLTAPPESWLWGERHGAARAALGFPGEMTLLPGVVLIALAVAGLVFSAWRVWQRVALAAGVLVSLALAAGTSFGGDGDPGYLTLMRRLPGWDALRTPGRLVLWTTLLLGVLAAGALTVREPPPAGAGRGDWRRWARVALALPALLVLAEGVNRTPHVPVPAQPVALRGVAGPVLVLPLGGIRDYHVMLWSTDGFPSTVNGLASFTPDSQQRIRAAGTGFPDAGSVAYLRAAGVRTVVLLPGYATGTPWQGAAARPVEGLGIHRERVGDAVVYHLDRAS
ncbi:hypothetical protein [Micromonospora purpureochromogenes]|uniref:4-amino-4-deoxy-L-arabinose transferase n=1 Tax=Micromonospora purpureochromogenes TaxID=47872 RepID=A0ABX2REB8_9ACTN|nr:hypothetical protein [Micromonospora purpureochromogenes]NYF54535.1 hypothetical protein [Micromonospora purpureochromogenes]